MSTLKELVDKHGIGVLVECGTEFNQPITARVIAQNEKIFRLRVIDGSVSLWDHDATDWHLVDEPKSVWQMQADSTPMPQLEDYVAVKAERDVQSIRISELESLIVAKDEALKRLADHAFSKLNRAMPEPADMSEIIMARMTVQKTPANLASRAKATQDVVDAAEAVVTSNAPSFIVAAIHILAIALDRLSKAKGEE